ncbi:response regulator [Erysipelothrix sp. P66]|uniref:response regulator n=2 Tax=Erysipelothrix TaxID=1647 RepID=UPI00315CF913
MNQGVNEMYTITIISHHDIPNLLDCFDPTWCVKTIHTFPLQSEDTDCFLVDIDYCDHDGAALIPWLKENYHKPIVIVTTRYRPKRTLELLVQGAQDYIVEPYNCEVILERITTLINEYKKRKHI